MALELRTLRGFVAVCAAGSISRAAERLHIAQPALSLQMKNLEEEFGADLLERTPRGVVATAAGEMLRSHATDILRRVEVAYEDVRTAIKQPQGRVAVGLPQSLAKLLTVPLVKEVCAEWPGIDLQIIEQSTGYIPQGLLTGHLDIGMTFGATPEPGLRADRVLEERLLLVGPPGELSAHGIGGISAAVGVPFSQLGRYPLILPAGLHGLRSLIDRFSASHDTELQVIAEVNAIPELIALAAAAAGFTILSHASVQEEWRSGVVSCGRIAEEGITRQVYLCRAATLPASLAVTTVWQRVLAITKRLVDGGEWPVYRFNAGGEGMGIQR
ncbi:LysR family transcriptional regulator [Cupriavidus taiwanensis]|uniref:LysR family transcriptional regulator n=1 Tax=Cupriavidus taiwanensis TaxID=164546 RepID=UPI000E104E8C|nr:LysR family transcriptional regulator [Cupriavidus taiwanensis]SOY42774.1 conserved exported hypothetical protein [Cupriavidus taiwanensis]SOY58872.1 conserved exported hypothetical protein [Cupriavidus taiwanensis]SOY80105.1 conserved exported hypothetical protein [Cupriavidus taiwanensis]SPA10190.1 conserved exported hypothetical protein [Cupriavidus taiwanensis]SPD42945.1 conserved protein of unknown function [Cupriavidus taiwanensis]